MSYFDQSLSIEAAGQNGHCDISSKRSAARNARGRATPNGMRDHQAARADLPWHVLRRRDRPSALLSRPRGFDQGPATGRKELVMRCRKNVRKLIVEYKAAADKTTTALYKFRQALVVLKSAPSQLAPPHNQANRYDDYVYIHQQSMAKHPPNDPGPHPGHRGPAFFPWQREFLRHFEQDLRTVSGDPTICLPYWDWSVEQTPADAGYPFFTEFLGGDGVGAGIVVGDGAFASVNGWDLDIADTYSGTPQQQANVHKLQRSFGNFGVANLPTRAAVINSLAVSEYDVSPWNVNASGPRSLRNRVEGWTGPQAGSNMHNRVHVWVGGSMLPGTPPNDPVFFLNHCKEDELWAVWMQKYPSVSHYLPLDSEPLPPGHTHLKRLSDHMESLAEYFGSSTIDRPIDLLDHKAITWYDTDLPEIVVESGPSIAFLNVPANLTQTKFIRFRVRTCRTTYFSVTAAPTGNFSVLGGPDFQVVPNEANDFEILEIGVQFHAVGANVQVAAIDLQAKVIDEEGYYAANQNDPPSLSEHSTSNCWQATSSLPTAPSCSCWTDPEAWQTSPTVVSQRAPCSNGQFV
jgi:hypothetical protein